MKVGSMDEAQRRGEFSERARSNSLGQPSPKRMGRCEWLIRRPDHLLRGHQKIHDPQAHKPSCVSSSTPKLQSITTSRFRQSLGNRTTCLKAKSKWRPPPMRSSLRRSSPRLAASSSSVCQTRAFSISKRKSMHRDKKAIPETRY